MYGTLSIQSRKLIVIERRDSMRVRNFRNNKLQVNKRLEDCSMIKTLKLKKIFLTGLCLCMISVFSMGLYARADSTDFTLTVNRVGINEDNISKRVKKSGGDAYENIWYVRATGITGKGSIYVQSMHLDKADIHSLREIEISSSDALNKQLTEKYNKNAPENEYYFLKGRMGKGLLSVNVVGRYTP